MEFKMPARLVLALGAESKLDVVPEALEFALPFSTLEDAHKVDNKLRTLERTNFGKGSRIRMAVVGCGYAGVELAATVAERLQDGGIVQAINVDSTICPTAPPGNREAANMHGETILYKDEISQTQSKHSKYDKGKTLYRQLVYSVQKYENTTGGQTCIHQTKPIQQVDNHAAIK
nr:isoform 2 of alternative nad(p)h-ubiquinone oxidoreductase c1, chloroplastic/mitochondrial [Quercus suber]